MRAHPLQTAELRGGPRARRVSSLPGDPAFCGIHSTKAHGITWPFAQVKRGPGSNPEARSGRVRPGPPSLAPPGMGGGVGRGGGSHKFSQIRGTGKRWCSYCPWDTETRPVPSSAVPCGAPARPAAPVPPTGDRGRGGEKPCPLAAAGTGPTTVRPSGPGIYLRPRRCPPEAAPRAPSPPLRVLGPARHLRPGTGGRGRVRG